MRLMPAKSAEHRDAARPLHSIEEGRATDQQQQDKKKQQHDRIHIITAPVSRLLCQAVIWEEVEARLA